MMRILANICGYFLSITIVRKHYDNIGNLKVIKNLLKILIFVHALVFLLSCNGRDSIDPIDGQNDMRTFLFGLHGYGSEQHFTARTSDPDTLGIIEGQLTLPESERFLHIHGTIGWGNGGYNLNWSWHFIPEEWNLVELSIEVCDGLPSHVENDLKYWIEDMGYFCPWSSYVIMELE